jgi:hypothetical protein
MWMAVTYGHELPEAELVAYQDRTFAPDRPTALLLSDLVLRQHSEPGLQRPDLRM